VTRRLAASVAAYGLPTEHQFSSDPLEDDEFDQLLGECEHHRIVGLLGVAVRDEAFPATDSQRERLENTWASWLAHALRAERLVVDAARVLEAHGIDHIVLKGVALAHTVYDDPAWRVFGDVDLLVEPQHFTRAANVLIADLGAVRDVPELRARFDDRFGKEILLRVGHLELDLHRMFVEGPYGAAMRLGDLWETPEPFTLGDREVLALGPAGRTLHAAYAAALGDWPLRLNAARDFVQTWVHDSAAFAGALELARRWRCEAVLDASLREARDTFGTEISDRHSPDTEISRRDRLFLESYRGRGRGYLRNFVAPIAIHGVRNKVAFLTAVALPDRAYLAARGADRTTFVRSGWAKVRQERREP
jgi:hypothetical protein